MVSRAADPGSHHHHSDNLDPAGSAFLPSAGRVLSTTKAAEELGGNVLSVEPWSEVEVESPCGASVKVSAVHAQHGPDGSDDIQGPVLGSVLSAPGAEKIYVSGDNASRNVVGTVVRETVELEVAILNAGAVQLSKIDGAYLTLSGEHARGCRADRRSSGSDPFALRRLGTFHSGRRWAHCSVRGQRDPRPPAHARARSAGRRLKGGSGIK
jgi:hypothetical protein